MAYGASGAVGVIVLGSVDGGMSAQDREADGRRGNKSW